MKFALSSLLMATMMLASPLLNAQDEEIIEEESTERVCISIRGIRSFEAFSNDHMYVKEGSSKHYLFTMRTSCHNLRNSTGIAIKDGTSRVCSDGFGEVVYRDRMSSQRLQSCRIDNIEQVESKDEAKAIAEARKEAKDDK